MIFLYCWLSVSSLAIILPIHNYMVNSKFPWNRDWLPHSLIYCWSSSNCYCGTGCLQYACRYIIEHHFTCCTFFYPSTDHPRFYNQLWSGVDEIGMLGLFLTAATNASMCVYLLVRCMDPGHLYLRWCSMALSSTNMTDLMSPCYSSSFRRKLNSLEG